MNNNNNFKNDYKVKTNSNQRIKSRNSLKRRRVESPFSKILFYGIIYHLVYYEYFAISTLGYCSNYFYIVRVIPILIGIGIYGIYKRAELKAIFKDKHKLIPIGFHIFKGFALSYLLLGQLTKTAWDIATMQIAKNNPIESFSCPVTKFQTRKGIRIKFKFNAHFESIYAPYNKVSNIELDKPYNYLIKLKMQNGLCNHYIVLDYEFIKRKYD